VVLRHEAGCSRAREIVRVARRGTLVVEVKGTAVDTSGTGAVDGGVVVYAEVGRDSLEGVFVGSPFDEGEAVKHGENTDIDSVVLDQISLWVPGRVRFVRGANLFDMIVELAEFDSVLHGRIGLGFHGRVNGTAL
jgi:hypothetical protein